MGSNTCSKHTQLMAMGYYPGKIDLCKDDYDLILVVLPLSYSVLPVCESSNTHRNFG